MVVLLTGYIFNLGFDPADLPVGDLPPTRRLSASDWMLLDAQSTPSRCTGRFLTMHKRRRKRLATRGLLQHNALLDDVQHGQVGRILDQCGRWAFNAFTLETCAGGRSLPVLCVHLFHWYGLLDHFKLDVVRVWKLFTLIEEGYHSTNPYHNSIHATDVTQAMHCFLQEEKIRKHMSPLEVMASLIGAVAHDLDHPGVNQHFLISTSNHLAALYENSSVLENHHWRSAVGCLLESGVAEQLSHCRAELEEQIRSLILATDITRQQEFITKFRKDLEEGTLELERFEDRHFILQIALKCADISNPTRPWDISHKWSLKVCQEFFRQGDFERKLNLPVTSLCDRQSTSVPKIQSGFFKFVVTPLFSEWHRFLSSSLSTHMMVTLSDNQKRWEKLEAAEQAEETQTELSDAEPEEISEADEETRGSSETLLLPVDFIPRKQSLAVPITDLLTARRHSMPVETGLTLPRTIIRRESLPPSRFGLPEIRLPNSRASSSHIREEDEIRLGSQTSLLSSNSGGQQSLEDMQERPLSAENLLPEPSIASMTSSAAADRLSSVMQGGFVAPATKCLTRQQTFPPLQPYVRIRYMSTTPEMTSCTEALIEGGSKSNSSHSSRENVDKSSIIPTITILSPNNCRGVSELVSSDSLSKIMSTCNNKREPEALEKEKATKIAKLSDTGQRYEKENVDPRKFLPTGLNIRRGSAPVTLSLVRPEESAPSAGGVLRSVEQLPRRGSMPIDVSLQATPTSERSAEPLSTASSIVPAQVEAYLLRQCPRRGSAPADSPLALTRHTSLNGKANRRKKQLRRRSSGGPETVCAQEVLGQDVWHRLRRDLSRRSENADLLLDRRRGSLPIEMLTVGHSVC